MCDKLFLGKQLLKDQDVVCFLGPSGTGKSFCASYLEGMGYTIVPQITTRAPRTDDTHYLYVSHNQFVEELNSGKILGYYSGNKNTLCEGNGYGYYKQTILDMLKNTSAKLILFPSAFELLSPNFLDDYNNVTKIAMTFVNPNSVAKRAKSAGKSFTEQELESRIQMVCELTNAINNYNLNSGDNNFHIILSDSFGNDPTISKKKQLEKVLAVIKLKNEPIKENL